MYYLNSGYSLLNPGKKVLGSLRSLEELHRDLIKVMNQDPLLTKLMISNILFLKIL